MTGYREIGSSGAAGDYTVERSQITHNVLGQAVSYVEKLTNAQAPGVTTTVTLSNLVYDALGRVATFQEQRQTTGSALVDKTERTATTYNNQSQVIGFTETRNHSGSGPDGAQLNSSETVERSGVIYNAAGQVAEYTEKVTRDGSIAVTRRFDITYNPQRQLTGYQEEGNVDGGETFHLTRSGMIYDANGNVTGYDETGFTSAGGDYSLQRRAMVYSSKGELLSYTEDTTQGASVSHSVRTQIQTNSLGQVVNYVETNSSPLVPDAVQTTTFTDGKYDLNGRLITFKQQRSSTATTFVETVTRTATELTGKGQTTGFTETRVSAGKDAAGKPLTITETVERKNVVYDAAGRVVSYVEETDSSLTPQKRVTEFSSATYDAQSCLLTFTEKVNEGGSVLSERTRLSTSYDAAGRMSGTIDKEKSAAAPDLETTVTVSQIIYDAAGIQTGFTQQAHSVSTAGPAVDFTTSFTRSEVTYGPFGRVVSYNEAGTSTDGVGYQTTRSNIQYDLNGQVVSYDESTTRPGTGTSTLQRTNIETVALQPAQRRTGGSGRNRRCPRREDR